VPKRRAGVPLRIAFQGAHVISADTHQRFPLAATCRYAPEVRGVTSAERES